jgi:cytochrome c-type biogenesis protein
MHWHGVPVVAAGAFAGALRGLRGLGPWSSRIEQASRVVILGVGLYLLWSA